MELQKQAANEQKMTKNSMFTGWLYAKHANKASTLNSHHGVYFKKIALIKLQVNLLCANRAK